MSQVVLGGKKRLQRKRALSKKNVALHVTNVVNWIINIIRYVINGGCESLS
jgi:hypothetical protein